MEHLVVVALGIVVALTTVDAFVFFPKRLQRDRDLVRAAAQSPARHGGEPAAARSK